MADVNSKPWRALALRANYHVANARLLLDLALETKAVPEAVSTRLLEVADELRDAQGHLQSIAELPGAI